MDEVKFYFVDKFKILGACSIFLMLTVSSSNLELTVFWPKTNDSVKQRLYADFVSLNESTND